MILSAVFPAGLPGLRAAVRRGPLVAALALGACGVALARGPVPAQAGIATAHPLATAAGEEILAAGGNAFDAAVAISAALAVVEPVASGLGGGAFFLLHRAKDGSDIFIDAREVAPGAARRDMYLDAAGKPDPKTLMEGPLAAGIPGEPAGLVQLAQRFGRLPLARSLAPAIRLAEQGVPMNSRMLPRLKFRRAAARRSPAFEAVFYPGGEEPTLDTIIRQPDLAATLRRLGDGGFDGYYRGRTAELLVAGVRAGGGIWTAADLAGYRVRERTPVRGRYRDLTIVSSPLPSAGGIGLVNMLNILAGYDLQRVDAPTRKHLIIESMRRVYRDRSVYLGDPDFVHAPVDMLTSPLYAAGERTSIRLDRATPSDALASSVPGATEGGQTTHFSVLDRAGNRVAATLSVNAWFGAVFIPPGTGVILNNEMGDFTVAPGATNFFGLVGGETNAIAPGKRMLSSMTPTFLESPRGLAIVGTPGGSQIISMVLLATLAWADGGDASAMVALPRYHHQYYPDVVSYEAGALTPDEIEVLEKLGHHLQVSQQLFGNMNVVTWDYASGRVQSATDPRGQKEGVVY